MRAPARAMLPARSDWQSAHDIRVVPPMSNRVEDSGEIRPRRADAARATRSRRRRAPSGRRPGARPGRDGADATLRRSGRAVALPAARGGRPGRHGRRLPRARSDARSRGRGEGAARRTSPVRPSRAIALEREAQAVAKLRHENILEIFDYSGRDSDKSFIVTEFIHGTTLRAFMQTHANVLGSTPRSPSSSSARSRARSSTRTRPASSTAT